MIFCLSRVDGAETNTHVVFLLTGRWAPREHPDDERAGPAIGFVRGLHVAELRGVPIPCII